MTQGDPLGTIAYGIGILHLIRELRDVHSCITHTWYADDAEAGGSFGNVLAHLQDLQGMVPPRG